MNNFLKIKKKLNLNANFIFMKKKFNFLKKQILFIGQSSDRSF